MLVLGCTNIAWINRRNYWWRDPNADGGQCVVAYVEGQHGEFLKFMVNFWTFGIALTLSVKAFEIAWFPKLLESIVDEMIQTELNMMSAMIIKTTIAWWWWCDGCEEMMKPSCRRCLQDHYGVQIPTHCNPLETFCKHNGDVLLVIPIWLCCFWWWWWWWWWCADNDEHGRIKFLANRVWKACLNSFLFFEHLKKSRNLKIDFKSMFRT